MSDYGSGYTFDQSGNVIPPDYSATPYPGEATTGNDPAGTIVSGSFGNNGGSVGDNGAGGTTAGDAGTGGGAPTQADYANLVKQYGPTAANQIMQQVSASNPNWAGQIGSLIKGGVSAVTGGGTTGGGTSGGSGSGGALGTTNLSMLIPAAATAYQQWNNAGQYTNQAEKYATQLNPYGAYRDAAAQKLAALQADPSSIANTPGYQFALSQGLGAVANRDNRSFGVGAGSTNPDMMNYAQGLASKTYNDTINQYSNQAGVNIGPQSAANILGQGMQGNIASQSNALNALMSPFGPGNNTGNTTVPTSSLLNNVFGQNSGQPPIDWNSITSNANGGGVSTGTQNTQQTTDPNLPPSNGAFGSYTGGA